MTRLFRIHPAPNVPFIGTVATDGNAEDALELAREHPWYGPQMTDEAVAIQCEEVWER